MGQPTKGKPGFFFFYFCLRDMADVTIPKKYKNANNLRKKKKKARLPFVCTFGLNTSLKSDQISQN